MYCYDRARLLAQDIKQSDEFLKYKALKDEVYKDESLKALLRQYKKLQFQYQTQLMSGGTVDDDIAAQMQKLGEVLAFNQKATEFLAAEYSLQEMINDIYKIIGDASEIDLDIFS